MILAVGAYGVTPTSSWGSGSCQPQYCTSLSMTPIWPCMEMSPQWGSKSSNVICTCFVGHSLNHLWLGGPNFRTGSGLFQSPSIDVDLVQVRGLSYLILVGL